MSWNSTVENSVPSNNNLTQTNCTARKGQQTWNHEWRFICCHLTQGKKWSKEKKDIWEYSWGFSCYRKSPINYSVSTSFNHSKWLKTWLGHGYNEKSHCGKCWRYESFVKPPRWVQDLATGFFWERIRSHVTYIYIYVYLLLRIAYNSQFYTIHVCIYMHV